MRVIAKCQVIVQRFSLSKKIKHPCRQLSTHYNQAHERSLKKREEFWAEAADDLTWFRKWDSVIDHSNPPFTKWFVGGEYSHCYNAVDRHVENGRGAQNALIHDSPVTNSVTEVTYEELLSEVSHLAGVLSKHGVKKGDRVMIYMPMIPQAIISMLATARLGAIHVVVFGGFASKELAVRINSCKPKIIICANYGIEPNRLINYKEMVDQATEMSQSKPLKTIVFQREKLDHVPLNRSHDLDWQEEMTSSAPHDCVPVPSNHPLYLLYTSGTTGLPKAAVRPTAGHSVVLHWSMKHIYGVDPGEAFWATADIGWVVGHSYVCHAPLVHGNTTIMYEVFWAAADIGWAVGHSYACHGPLLHGNTGILYEGKPVGTPDASSFFRVLADHKAVGLFTAPTALRAIKREDPKAEIGPNYDLSKFRTLFVAGEHCDRDTAEWASKAFNAPALDHWWQTETGHAITASCVGLGSPLDPPAGSTGLPVPGWDVQIVDDEGNPVPRGQLGNIVVKLPLNLGTFQTIWQDDERFVETYFKKYPGFYDTMDAGIQDQHGYISVMSRTDDVINVAGHRLSCGHIEEVIGSHEAVAESAVVAKKDDLKGAVPFAYVVLKPGYMDHKDKIDFELIQSVREHIGPVAAFRELVFVQRLPKTRSGKTPRKSLEAVINNQEYNISPTIEDESVYPEIEEVVKSSKYYGH